VSTATVTGRSSAYLSGAASCVAGLASFDVMSFVVNETLHECMRLQQEDELVLQSCLGLCSCDGDS
jgi:hypothetical protein